MALNELNFTFTPEEPNAFPIEWHHSGVVGSGDMEVMFEQKDLGGKVEVKVVTPVSGFDDVWERVLERYVNSTGVSDASIEINDNNATPVVVSMRLRQATREAFGEV